MTYVSYFFIKENQCGSYTPPPPCLPDFLKFYFKSTLIIPYQEQTNIKHKTIGAQYRNKILWSFVVYASWPCRALWMGFRLSNLFVNKPHIYMGCFPHTTACPCRLSHIYTRQQQSELARPAAPPIGNDIMGTVYCSIQALLELYIYTAQEFGWISKRPPSKSPQGNFDTVLEKN